MAKCKRILCAILSVAMMLTIVPMGTIGASAADVAFDTAAVDNGDGKIVVPNVTLESTKVIRVASDASGNVFTNGTTIVPATPSGLPKINGGYAAQYYVDETPVSPQVVFTTDVALASAPSISCENNTGVTFSDPVQTGNTYTWTITGGTGVTVGELKFVVDYSTSYTDSLTGKTVERFYKAYTTSYVETIAQPGAFSAFRSRTGSVGHENVRCSYIVRILGANSYGGFAAYNDEEDEQSAHGYYDFINNFWVDLGSTNAAMGYGTMIYEVSNDSGDGSRMINANADHWRPTSTTYIDRGMGTSLSQVNLRLTQFERQGDRKDGYTYYARYSRMKVLQGSVYAHTDAIDHNASRVELGLSLDLVSDVQLANHGYTNVPLTGSTYGNSSTLDEATGNYYTDYTLVYSGGSHYSKVDRVANADITMGIRIESYDKSELRGYVDELLTANDPTTKLAASSENGINPQSWFYSDGWDAYKAAFQKAQGILNKPNTTQNEINAALSELDTAEAGLKVATADYSVVEIAKAEAAKLNALNYTEESWARVTAALDAAEAAEGYSVFYQPAVDKLAMDIDAAIAQLEEGEASWDLVNEAIAVYEQLDPTKYTSDSWAVLRNAVNAAEEAKLREPAYSVSEQAEVNEFAQAISDAIGNLKDALADYTSVEEQVERYNTIVVPEMEQIEAELEAAGIKLEDYGLTSVYTTASWRRMQAALNYDKTLTWQYQEDVYDFADQLRRAIDERQLADAYYDDVYALLEEAESYDPAWYTPDSYAKLEEAIEAVVEDKKINEQLTVNAYAEALDAAIRGLKEADADYTEVINAEDRMNNLDTSLYTPESYEKVLEAYEAINWNLMAEDQDKVDAFAEALNTAIDELDYVGADYTDVIAAENRWKAITDTSMYTNASIAEVVNAINAVDYSKTILEQDEVDAMADAINYAIDHLVLKGADYTELKAALSAAKTELNKHNSFLAANGVGYYTDETIADLIEAIEAVPVDASGAVLEDKNYNQQAEVDALTEALVNAKTALKANGANYTELDAILLTVPSDEDLEKLYTVETASALMLAVINANAVDRDLTVDDQATIDALVAEVDTAIKNLKFKDADYTSVENAKIAAEAKLAEGIWTAASAQAVRDAINAVEYGKDINEQAAVYAMADAINNAANNLVPEYANYDKVDAAKAEVEKINTAIVTPESYKRVTDAVAAVVYNLYAKDQATVDGYAQAITDAIAALEFVYADWSEVDALITEINNLNPADYANYDEIYWLHIYNYVETTIPAEKAKYVYVDTQAQVDAVYDQLLAYKNMLEPVAITSIAVTKAPTKVEYVIGDAFDATGLTIKADYNNGTSATLTEGFTLSEVDMSTAGEKTVTVTYEGKTATFTITVAENQAVARFEVVGGASVKTQGGVKYIVGLQTSLTKAKFQSTFVDYENVTLTYKMTTSRYMGTGSTVTVTSTITGEVIGEYVIVIYGDVDGSATINARDGSRIAASIAGTTSLSQAEKLAANVEGARVQINAKDKAVIQAVVAGTMVIDQATGKGVEV
ncbi:MAG: bacterial Ig-like domain-containing protein [Clostridia bacterium]|nr:bacterial Ig-like domain-containing protein [Clostridia bacterium]